MTTTVERPRPLSAQQRGAEATTRLKEVLGIDDLKLLSTALAEVAADEARRNAAFAERVRMAYSELASLKPKRPATRSPKNELNDTKLIPVKRVEGYKFDPYAKLDPFFICEVYGSHQLRAAMTGYSLAKLKEAVEFVQAKYPGTKPKTMSRKDDIIDYIVTYVKSAE